MPHTSESQKTQTFTAAEAIWIVWEDLRLSAAARSQFSLCTACKQNDYSWHIPTQTSSDWALAISKICLPPIPWKISISKNTFPKGKLELLLIQKGVSQQSSNPKIGMAPRYPCPKSSERLLAATSPDSRIQAEPPPQKKRGSNSPRPQFTMVLWHFTKSSQNRLDLFFWNCPWHSAWLPVEAGEIDTNQDHSAAASSNGDSGDQHDHWTSDSRTRMPWNVWSRLSNDLTIGKL